MNPITNVTLANARAAFADALDRLDEALSPTGFCVDRSALLKENVDRKHLEKKGCR